MRVGGCAGTLSLVARRKGAAMIFMVYWNFFPQRECDGRRLCCRDDWSIIRWWGRTGMGRSVGWHTRGKRETLAPKKKDEDKNDSQVPREAF